MKFKDLPIINLFFKKEEKEQYPGRFAMVELTNVAKIKGLHDDYNKVIKIFEYGEIVKEYPYTKETLESIKQVDKLPIFEEQSNPEEEFEFDSFEELGVSKYVRHGK